MRLNLTRNQIIVLFCLYAVMVLNLGFWQKTWDVTLINNKRDWLLVLTMPLFLIAFINFVMQLLFWPKIHRLILPFLILAGSGASYATMTQQIYFNSDMIQNLLQSNPAEASAWLSVKFILWIVLTGVLPVFVYLRYVKVKYSPKWYSEMGSRLLSMVGSLVVIGAIAAAGYQNYASFFFFFYAIPHQIAPTNLIAAMITTAYGAYDANRPFVQIGTDAKRNATPSERKRLLVFVVGETTRAQSWGLNSGVRNTTPELAKTEDVINYPNFSSCGTATAISLPCMFSNMARKSYKPAAAKHSEGLMDILQRGGLYTSWRENDGGCKGTCDRIKHIQIDSIAQAGQCSDDGCYDMTALNGLAEEIRNMPTDGIIVLHTMGSHGPAYYQRYTDEFKKFTPTCDTNQLQDCSTEQLNNTYDNTVVYIDHMLASTIKLLQEQPNSDTALIYASDHGESLGENGMYLHGAPYAVAPKEQTQVPMIFWASKGFYQTQKLNQDCLVNSAATEYSHDNLFHSILGLMDVQTKEYQRDLDIFSSCRPAH